MAATVSRLPTAARRKVHAPTLTATQLAQRGVTTIAPARQWVDPREAFSAQMIIAQAILAQLTPEQRRDAQNMAHRLYCEIGTDAAQSASAFMASI